MRFCLAIGTGILLTNSVFAAEVPLEIFEGKLPLHDSELAEMRGKYTENGQDFYFGLHMQTHYIDTQGAAQQVHMQVELAQVAGGPTMRITVGDTVSNTNGAVNLSRHGQQGGLQQSIQIAGDFNRVDNQFDLAPGSLTPLVNGVEIVIGQTLVNSRGDVVYSTAEGQLGYQVAMPTGAFAQGVASQGGNGQLLQSIRVDGAFHQVSNHSLIRYNGISLGVKQRQLMGMQVRDIIGIGL
ncbi:hypothetical protein [Shewanella fidelis]|uniref:Uncharacterized protein n=1 Tax=Shewanella fidelis TaxID=173509 RepID=A0AAW8NS14_9GAMM|nr:hypothetical protein [Shewanella fidelis]MDR8525195.1 hypothetical protein [Shewanella fidelis]MDW4811266.1 hypothetical protein [Shewanella fidelis]MDW4814955.1 hypothetical protein [Shewanella fidelis]MDW4819045.1 hypothetical protein [Shewanella fidelis]MDW4823278.1 hypothetical protein [Shewanella fidelis]